MLCRPPETKQMTGSGKPDVTPQHVLELALGDLGSVSGSPSGYAKGVRKGGVSPV